MSQQLREDLTAELKSLKMVVDATMKLVRHYVTPGAISDGPYQLVRQLGYAQDRIKNMEAIIAREENDADTSRSHRRHPDATALGE